MVDVVFYISKHNSPCNNTKCGYYDKGQCFYHINTQKECAMYIPKVIEEKECKT